MWRAYRNQGKYILTREILPLFSVSRYQTSDAAHSKAAVGGFVPLIKGLFDSIPAKLAAASASVI